MNYRLSRRDARLSAVLFSPWERIESSPAWAKAFGLSAGVLQYVRNDAFLSALCMVFVIGIVDYILGVKAARMTKSYDPVIAHRGAMGKLSGLILICLIRMVEHFLFIQGLVPATHGMVATAAAISLFAIDLQSIAHHREEFGAQPIPVFGTVFAWLQRLATSKLPPLPDPADTPQRRSEDPKA